MASIIQRDYFGSNSENEFPPANTVTIAYHRRAGISLQYHRGEKRFTFVQLVPQHNFSEVVLASFESRRIFSKFATAFPVESMQCFAFLGANLKRSCLLLVNFIDGSVMASFPFSQHVDISAADCNHANREFYVGFESGATMALYLKVQEDGSMQLYKKKTFKISISELQVEVPKQIVSLDACNQLLILSKKRMILCVDSSNFEVLYSISPTSFSIPPVKLWPNKLGHHFLVHCRSSSNNSSNNNNSHQIKEQIECWIPPHDYATALNGCFFRAILPLSLSSSSPVVNVCFETIGLGEGRKTISIVTADKRLQLWSLDSASHDSEFRLDAETILSLPWAKIEEHATNMTSSDSYLVNKSFQQLLPGISTFYPTCCRTSEKSAMLLLFFLSSPPIICDIDYPSRCYNQRTVDAFMQFEMMINEIHPMTRPSTGDNMMRQPQQRNSKKTKQPTTANTRDKRVAATVAAEAAHVIQISLESDDDNSTVMSESIVYALESLAQLKKSVDEQSENMLELHSRENIGHESSLQLQSPTNAHADKDDKATSPSPMKKAADYVSDLSVRGLEPLLLSSQKSPLRPILSAESTIALPSPAAELQDHASEVSSLVQMLSDEDDDEGFEVYEGRALTETVLFHPVSSLSRRQQQQQQQSLPSSAEFLEVLHPHGLLRLSSEQPLKAFTTHGLVTADNHSMDSNHLKHIIQVRQAHVALRAGLIVVLTELRECFVFNLLDNDHTPCSRPLIIPFTLRNIVHITAIHVADISLEEPVLLSSGKGNKQLPSKEKSASWIAIFIGDSEGVMHTAYVNFNLLEFKLSSFIAHNQPIHSIFTTADACRPLWKVSIAAEFQAGKVLYKVMAVPGSPLVSMSAKGEVKVWQPSSQRSKASDAETTLSSIHQVMWRVSGLFILPRRPSFICLSPTCLSLLVGYMNGNIEQWLLPGLLLSAQQNQGGGSELPLVSTQDSCWSSFVSCHRDSIVCMRVTITSSQQQQLTEIKKIPFTEGEDKDKVLITLCSYLKVDNHRAKYTMGWTYKEIRAMVQCSAMVSSSQDKSLVVWAFEQFFDNYCSHLRPYQTRKLYLSSVPSQALLVPAVNSSHSSGSNERWAVYGVLNGRLVNLLEDDKLLLLEKKQIDSSNEEGQRITKQGIIGEIFQHRRRRAVIISSLPVMCHVHKPAKLVTAARAIEGLQDEYGSLLAVNALETWTKIRDAPMITLVKLSSSTSFHPAHSKTSSHHVQVDAIPSHNPSLSPSVSMLPLTHAIARPLSPEQQEQQAQAAVRAISPQLTGHGLHRIDAGSSKLLESGFRLTINDGDNEDELRAMVADKHNRQRFIVEKIQEEEEGNEDQQQQQVKQLSRGESRSHHQHRLHRPPSAHFPQVLHEQQSRPSISEGDIVNQDELRSLGETQFSVTSANKEVQFKNHLDSHNHHHHPNVIQIDDEVDPPPINEIHFASLDHPNRELVMSVELQAEDVPFQQQQQQQQHGISNNHAVNTQQQHRPAALINNSKSAGKLPTARKDKAGAAGFTYVSKTSLEKQDLQRSMKSSNSNSQINGRQQQAAVAASIHGSGPSGLAIIAAPRPPPAVTITPAPSTLIVNKATVAIVVPPIINIHTQLDTAIADDSISSKDHRLLESDSAPVLSTTVAPISQQQPQAPALSTLKPVPFTTQKYILKKEKPVPAPRVITATKAKKANAAAGKKPVAVNKDEQLVNDFDDEQDEQDKFDDIAADVNMIDLQSNSEGKASDSNKLGMSRRSSNKISFRRTISSLDEVDDDEGNDIADISRPPSLKRMTSFTIDLPNQKEENKRRRALQLSKQLQSQGIVVAELDHSSKNNNNDGNSSDEGITTFFDRNAAPIVKAKPLPKRHRLISKRFDLPPAFKKSPPRSPLGKDNGDDDDDSMTFDDEATVNSTNAAATAVAIKTADPVERFMADMNEEELQQFHGLDESVKEQLLTRMKSAKPGDFKLMRSMTLKVFAHTKVVQMIKMDIILDTLEISDRSCKVSIASEVGGPVFIILTDYQENATPPPSELIRHEDGLHKIPGYREHRKATITANAFVELSFHDLHPSYKYMVYAIVDRSTIIAREMNDNLDLDELEFDWPPMTVEIMMAEEQLEIEWDRLDLEMRTTELRAAIRSEYVQVKARNSMPEAILPDDDLILNEDFQAVINPQSTKKTLDRHRERLLIAHHQPLLSFLEWWIGDEFNTSKVRAEFQLLECLHSIIRGQSVNQYAEDGFGDEEDISLLKQIALNKLNNSSRFKSSFSYSVDKLASSDNKEEEIKQHLSIDSNDNHSLTMLDIDAGNKLLKRFRSWFKGGQVIEDFEMIEDKKANVNAFVHAGNAERRGITLEDSVSFESSSAANDKLTRKELRLFERTQFLHSLIIAHDNCIEVVSELIKSYKYANSKKLREASLIADRAKLTLKETHAVMACKKILALSISRGLFAAELATAGEFDELKPFPVLHFEAMDPYQHMLSSKPLTKRNNDKQQQSSSPLFLLVLQRIAGVELFSIVNPESLKAENAPPLHVKTLPGTNRKPLKPWQMMTKQEQDLEMILACSLDYIWELCLEDGIELPDAEDRLLSSDHFPHRLGTWEIFRRWYAGEEETNAIPGQGVPTLARVLFAERFEARQVEGDIAVLEAMKVMKLPLPRRYLIEQQQQPADEISVVEDDNGSSIAEAKQSLSLDISVVSTDHTAADDNNGETKAAAAANAVDDNASSSSVKSVDADDLQTLTIAYEKIISTTAGTTLRNETIIGKALSKLVQSRRMSTMKWLWPPGLNRTGWQYIFPRSAFLLPSFSMPSKRYTLFPLRVKDAFNSIEIMGWYKGYELDSDDQAMRIAEEKGVKLRAYHEWLAHEPERIAESREQMLMEDNMARERRQIDEIIEHRLQLQVQKMIKFDEDFDNGDCDIRGRPITELERILSGNVSRGSTPKAGSRPRSSSSRAASRPMTGNTNNTNRSMVEGSAEALMQKFFRLNAALPKEYWYIFEESTEFKHGSGIHNDDEAEEVQEQQREIARKALADAENFERYLNEEKKRRDYEEKARVKRDDQDRRLKEGMIRRRQIRENLEDLKRQRIIKAAEEKMVREEQEAAELAKKQQLILEAEELKRQQRIEAERQHELRLMHKEETLTRDLKVQQRELRLMEHEDILSFLQEQMIVRREIYRRDRMAELEELYQPFEPFQFKKSRITLPQLHEILKDEMEQAEEEEFLQEMMEQMSEKALSTTDTADSNNPHHHHHEQHGSQAYFTANTLMEHDTESTIRHRSRRFSSLYGDNVHFHPERLHSTSGSISSSYHGGGGSHSHQLLQQQQSEVMSDSRNSINKEDTTSVAVMDDDLDDDLSADDEDGESQARASTQMPSQQQLLQTVQSQEQQIPQQVQHLQQISTPRCRNLLNRRSLDDYPTRRRLLKIVKQVRAEQVRQGKEHTTAIVNSNPYDSKWQMQRMLGTEHDIQQQAVLSPSRPSYFMQPTFFGTGTEALLQPIANNSNKEKKKDRSRSRSPHEMRMAKLLQPLSSMPPVRSLSQPVLLHPSSSQQHMLMMAQTDPLPSLQLSAPQRDEDSDIMLGNQQQILQTYYPSSEQQQPTQQQFEGGDSRHSLSQSISLAQDSSSLFRPSHSSDGNPDSNLSKQEHRKKLHALLDRSAQVINSSNLAWLDLQRTQRKLAAASLSTLEARRPQLLPLLSQQQKDKDNPRDSTADFEHMGYHTAKMAHAATAAVHHIQQQRILLREYVKGDGVIHDRFRLAACEAGAGYGATDALNLSPVAKRFQQEIAEKVRQDELNDQQGLALTPLVEEKMKAKQTKNKKKQSAANSSSLVLSSVTGNTSDILKKHLDTADNKAAAPGPKAVGALFGASLTAAHRLKLEAAGVTDVITVKKLTRASGNQKKKSDNVFAAAAAAITPNSSMIVLPSSKVQDMLDGKHIGPPTPLASSSPPSNTAVNNAPPKSDSNNNNKNISRQQPAHSRSQKLQQREKPLSLEEDDMDSETDLSLAMMINRGQSPTPKGLQPPTPGKKDPLLSRPSVRSLDLFIMTPNSHGKQQPGNKSPEFDLGITSLLPAVAASSSSAANHNNHNNHVNNVNEFSNNNSLSQDGEGENSIMLLMSKSTL